MTYGTISDVFPSAAGHAWRLVHGGTAAPDCPPLRCGHQAGPEAPHNQPCQHQPAGRPGVHPAVICHCTSYVPVYLCVHVYVTVYVSICVSVYFPVRVLSLVSTLHKVFNHCMAVNLMAFSQMLQQQAAQHTLRRCLCYLICCRCCYSVWSGVLSQYDEFCWCRHQWLQ